LGWCYRVCRLTSTEELRCRHFISRFFFLTTSWKIGRQEKKIVPCQQKGEISGTPCVQLTVIQNLKPKIFFEIIADIKKIMVLFYRFYLKKRKRHKSSLRVHGKHIRKRWLHELNTYGNDGPMKARPTQYLHCKKVFGFSVSSRDVTITLTFFLQCSNNYLRGLGSHCP
jgi:hypothetical protein